MRDHNNGEQSTFPPSIRYWARSSHHTNIAILLAEYSNQLIGWWFILSTQFKRYFNCFVVCIHFSKKFCPDIYKFISHPVGTYPPVSQPSIHLFQTLDKSASIHSNVVREGGGGMAIIWCIWYWRKIFNYFSIISCSLWVEGGTDIGFLLL